MKKSFLFLAIAAGLIFGVAPGLIASETQLLEGASPVAEPYLPLQGGSFSGEGVPLSPDPLVTYRWNQTNPTDELQTYLLAPVKVTADQPASFGNLESAKGTNCDVIVNGAGSIQFDFGVENAAWLEFDSPDLTGDVKMSISEYNEPSIMSGVPNAVKTKTPVKYGNTYRLELNNDLYEGVRFGWIHVRTFSTSWRITAVRLVCQTKPVNYEGSFTCSDPLLTRMWYVGAYGVKLNMLHNNLGAILMDRGDRISWTGDNYPAHAAIMSTFADYPFVKASLDRTATNDNGIASYSLYWVLSLMDYYRYSGDAAALQQHAANAKAKLQTANQIYANPTLKFFGWDERLGAGFQEAEVPIEPKDAFRMVFIRACREFAEGMRTIGNTVDADTFDQLADQRIAELRTEGTWEGRFGLHAAADAVNAGFTSQDEQARLFDKEFSDRATRNSFSSFNQYFVIQAMARMNRYDEALASIRDHWGGQIEYGGTAFFETYWPAWTQILGPNDTIPNSQAGKTSLCHPWGSGITKWLTEEVLGIKPTSPGFTTYDIFPHLGRTLTEVSGNVSTPKGDIHASFDIASGEASVQAPAGTTGRIGIPKAEKTIGSIQINGELAWDGTFHAVAGVGGASANGDFVIFSDVQPGSYEMTVAYSGVTPTFTDVPWQFPTTFVKEDRTTSGGWGGKYGVNGSVIFGADGANNDRIQLPSYVASVTRQWGTVGSFPVAADSRAPGKDSINDQPRSNGVFYTGQTGLKQCLVLDIALKQPTDYQLALYFVDLDRKGRRQTLELLDLNTRKLIAPTRIYADFEDGMYAVYNCDRSVRLRVNQVRGDNAVLSGIFFDSPIDPPDNPPLNWTGSQGSAGNASWTTGTANNWSALYDTLAPLNFTQTGVNRNIGVPAPLTALSMTFTHTGGTPYAFSGSKITVSNGITSTLSSTGVTSFANAVQASSGVTLEGDGRLTFNGDLESNGLNLAGPGSITLTADNDDAGTPLFTGTAWVSAGTLNIANDLAVKSATVSMTGGIANFTTAAPFVANVSGTGGTVNLGSTALTVGTGSLANQSTSYAGNITQASGMGSIIKDGASNLTLSGLNAYTGSTRVKGGTLQLARRQSLYNANTASWTSGNLVVDSGATLGFNVGGFDEFGESDMNALALVGFANGSILGINTTATSPTTNFTLSRDLSGGVGLYKKGPSKLTLTGTNSNTGATTISAGTLVAAGSGHVTLPGDVQMGDGSNNSVYLTMGADNQFNPTSVLHFNNPNTNNSDTKAQLRGTRQTIAGLDSPATAFRAIIQNDDTTVPDYVSVPLLGASLTINTPENSSYSFRGIIRNQTGPALSVTKNGPGTQEFINLSTVQAYGYTGPTTINAGTLRINFASGNSGFGSDITINKPSGIPATLHFRAGNGNYSFTRRISGEGKVVVDGTSAVILTNGGNSWSGGTTVDGGFLALSNGSNSGQGNGPGQTCVGGAMDPANVITVNNGGTLSLDNTAPLGNSPVLPQYALSIHVNDGSRIYGGTNSVVFVSNVTLNGGFIEIAGGANTGGFGTNIALVGTVVVGGTSVVPASIFTNANFLPGGATPSSNANVSLGSIGLPGTVFQVADVTSSPASDLTIRSILRNIQSVASPLTKTGSGTLVLEGTNTYTGDTTVSAGLLMVNGASIVDTNSLVLAGGKLGLTAGETVGKLYFGGTQQIAGTYGSTSSTAVNKDNSRFTGSGVLTVTTNPINNPYVLWSAAIANPVDRDKPDDPDGDGFTNREEFLFGTSPITNSGNLTTFGKSGASLVLRWCQRATGGTYVLQESPALGSPWTTSTVVPVIAADQTGLYSVDYVRKEAIIPIDSARKFARVQATE